MYTSKNYNPYIIKKNKINQLSLKKEPIINLIKIIFLLKNLIKIIFLLKNMNHYKFSKMFDYNWMM